MLKDEAAAHYLADLACEVVFRHPGPMLRADLLHGLALRLPVDAEVLEAVLSEDQRFIRPAGRWDLRPRPLVPDRPLGGALADLLECYGRPMPRALLISELCLSRPGSPPQMAELLDRLLGTGRDLGRIEDCLYRTSWLANLGTSDPQGQLSLNDLADDQQFITLRKKLTAAGHKQRHALDTALAVLKTAKLPVHNRALGLVLSAHHGERFDPADTFAQMCCDERFICLSGPTWSLRTQAGVWERALAGSGGEVTEEAAADIGQVLAAAPSPRLKLAAATLVALQELPTATRTPVGVEEGVREVLGLRPRQRQFVAAAQAVDGVFAGDLSLVRLRPGRYLRREAVPPWVATVPEALLPHGAATGERESPLIPLSELPGDLAGLAMSPYYEDVGETEVTLAEEPLQRTQIVVPWHHHGCGTLRLRQCDRRFFDLPATVTVLTLVTPDDQRWPVWANSQTRLLYGLLAWYDEALPVSGAVLTLSRGDAPDTYVVEHEGEVDPAARVSDDRLEQLLHLRERLQRRPTTLAQAAAAVVQDHAKGLAFDPLWFQLNLVRRTTRHQLASALVAAGDHFQQDGSKRWHAGT